MSIWLQKTYNYLSCGASQHQRATNTIHLAYHVRALATTRTR